MNSSAIPKFARRPLSAVLVLLGIVILNFALIQATDTGRLRNESLAQKTASPEEVERRIEAFRKEFDLDRPLHERFVRWLGRVVVFDFGSSMVEQRTVGDIVGEALKKSLWLQIPAIILYFLIGIPLGVVLAKQRHGLLDKTLSPTLLVGYSMPTFWLATLLLVYFATPSGMTWFPMEGLASEGADNLGTWDRLLDKLKHMVLPVIALAIPGITIITRQTRSAMLETLGQDYILAARAAGVSESKVIWRHALRSSLTPAATLFGLLLPQLVAGSVVVERVFNIRGVGRVLLESAENRDFPVLQTIFLLTTILTLVGFVLSDYLTSKMTPGGKVSTS